MDGLADSIDWEACHSRGKAAAGLRHLRRNPIPVRVIAAISGSPVVAVYVGEVIISIIAGRWDIGLPRSRWPAGRARPIPRRQHDYTAIDCRDVPVVSLGQINTRE